MSDAPQQRYWHFYVTLPADGKSKYQTNKTLGIVAPTIQDGLALVSRLHPTATVWTINHRGTVDHSVTNYESGFHREDANKGVKW